jgi:hypothetical protein
MNATNNYLFKYIALQNSILFKNQGVTANDLSLAIGSTRVDWKVTLMQLGHQFNYYNLMHNQESQIK